MFRFYTRHILPHLIHAGMSRDDLTRLRAANVPAAHGVVVEIGIGSGLNVPFYSSAVTRLYGVDSSPELLAMANRRTEGTSFPVSLIHQSAERLPLADRTADSAVVTWSLCSIDNPASALRELRRVLKPGGALIFVEHGQSPDVSVQTWQNRLTPLWRHVSGNCHLNRKVDDLIRNAGFAIEDLRTSYIPGPRVSTFIYQGRASIDDGR